MCLVFGFEGHIRVSDSSSAWVITVRAVSGSLIWEVIKREWLISSLLVCCKACWWCVSMMSVSCRPVCERVLDQRWAEEGERLAGKGHVGTREEGGRCRSRWDCRYAIWVVCWFRATIKLVKWLLKGSCGFGGELLL